MYATCIGLILRGYDDFESNRLRFISNNTEESFLNNAEVEGTFVNMAKTFEATPQELLDLEFGETLETISQDVSGADHIMEGSNFQMDFTSNNSSEGTSETSANENIENAKANRNGRATLVNDIFKTVKNKVMFWFENVDDEKLDNG